MHSAFPDPAPTTLCESGVRNLLRARIKNELHEPLVGADGLSWRSKVMFGEQDYIQERDWKLLRVIYEEQFLTYKTITRFFFGGVRSNASRRLRILQKQKLIRWEPVLESIHKRVVRITRAGVNGFRDQFPIEVKQLRKVALATFSHDVAVGEVRLALTKLYDAQWVPERAMKESQGLAKIPDGILTFASGRRIAVEVENTVKSQPRYEAMWREWEGQNFTLILYVATQDGVYRALLKKMQQHPLSSVRFGLIKMNDLMGSPNTVWTPKGELPLFSKREF